MSRYPVVGLLNRIWELRDNVSAHDASYVALAGMLDCALLTADARLTRTPGMRCTPSPSCLARQFGPLENTRCADVGCAAAGGNTSPPPDKVLIKDPGPPADNHGERERTIRSRRWEDRWLRTNCSPPPKWPRCSG